MTDADSGKWSRIDPAAEYPIEDAAALVGIRPGDAAGLVAEGAWPVTGSRGRWWVRGADLLAWVAREKGKGKDKG